MTLDQYIEDLVRLRDQHTAGDCTVVQIPPCDCDCDLDPQTPEKPSIKATGGGKWVVEV